MKVDVEKNEGKYKRIMGKVEIYGEWVWEVWENIGKWWGGGVNLGKWGGKWEKMNISENEAIKISFIEENMQMWGKVRESKTVWEYEGKISRWNRESYAKI